MDYNERIKQCSADIVALQEQRVKLLEEQQSARKYVWKHGDTAISCENNNDSRLFIQGPCGLMIFSLLNGHAFNLGGSTAQQWANNFNYKKTGNIFAE